MIAAGIFAFIQYRNKNAGKITGKVARELIKVIPKKSSAGAMGDALPVMEIEGFSCVGLLEVPSLDLKLPVGDKYQNVRILPCQESGTPQKNDLIITGSSSNKSFTGLSRIKIGKRVTFTDLEGNRYKYKFVSAGTIRRGEEADADLVLYYPVSRNKLYVICCEEE